MLPWLFIFEWLGQWHQRSRFEYFSESLNTKRFRASRLLNHQVGMTYQTRSTYIALLLIPTSCGTMGWWGLLGNTSDSHSHVFTFRCMIDEATGLHEVCSAWSPNKVTFVRRDEGGTPRKQSSCNGKLRFVFCAEAVSETIEKFRHQSCANVYDDTEAHKFVVLSWIRCIRWLSTFSSQLLQSSQLDSQWFRS